jgi:hypothetical protein
LLSTSCAFVALLGTEPAGAQVGHDPAKSPYRDLRWGQFFSVSAGRMFGSGGTLGIGPHDGPVIWVRHEFLADKPITVALSAGYSKADRNYADSLATATATRLKGPVDQKTWFGEASFQLNLAGTKTWHDLAPYASMGLGLAFGSKVPNDVTGYKFGTRFYLAPSVGVRAFVTRRLYLRVEARAVFWSLSYPATYRLDPDGVGPLTGLLTGQALKEWAPAPMLHAGLGYAFKNPFF